MYVDKLRQNKSNFAEVSDMQVDEIGLAQSEKKSERSDKNSTKIKIIRQRRIAFALATHRGHKRRTVRTGRILQEKQPTK